MLTAAGLMVLCLSITMSPFLEVTVFDYFSDLDWNYNSTSIGQIVCSFINGHIGQTNGYNDFIFFNAYASASFSRLFFSMLGM